MPINREQITNRIVELAAAQVDVDPTTVSLESRFIDDLNYDSLEQVEFTMNLEEEFEIDLPDEQATDVQTVGEAIALALSLLGGATDSISAQTAR